MENLAATYFKSDFNGRTEGTVYNHRVFLRAFFEFLSKRPLTVEVYSDWVRYCFDRWGDRTARNVALGASARFLGWAERMGHIPRSPHRLVRMPRPVEHGVRAPYSVEEFNALVVAAAESDPALEWAIRLAWESGMALVDCCLLQWASVNLDKALIHMRRQKSKEPCLIPLDADGEVMRRLNLWVTEPRSAEWPNIKDSWDYVHPELAGQYLVQQRMHTAGLQMRFRRLADSVGIEGKTFHNLRASFISSLANSSMNLAAACRVSGHRDPKIFTQYVTANHEQLRDQVLSALAARRCS